MDPRARRVSLLAAVALAAALALAAARRDGGRPDDHGWFDPVIDVRALLLEGFVERPDAEKMQKAAIRGMVESLGDPFTTWIPPADEAEFTKSLRGNYVGIGCEIDTDGSYLRVVSPFEDSPAERAGVRPGDLILEIDGISTFEKRAAECTRLLLGDPGTEVRLTVRHRDNTEEVLTVVRGPVQARTVKGLQRGENGWTWLLSEDSGLAYVRLTQFTETTAADLRAALAEIRRLGARGLLLDLRFNGGGSLGSAVEVADLFLPGGEIVSVRGRRDPPRVFSAGPSEGDLDLPLVVLVNDASASASEIVAGALQENGRAKVLGVRTYGKGSVQEVRDLPEGRGALKMTTAKYYLPSGRNLHREPDAIERGAVWGVDPDPGFHVTMTPAEANRSFRLRRRFEVPGGEGGGPPPRFDDPEWLARGGDEQDPDAGLGDPQLAAAVRAIAARLASGAWTEVGDDGGQVAAVEDEIVGEFAYRDRLERELGAVNERIRKLEAAREETPEP